MEIKIESQIGICEEFMEEAKGKKAAVSIVISPLKVVGGDEVIQVTSGCNMWQACRNQRCHFSSEARKLPKVKRPGG
ncbi:MAG: hypothetical protein Q8P59_09960 [Dehalococcoidia bacterium]|nr:hypothetical protein [Dehalococcoidia bacterium]